MVNPIQKSPSALRTWLDKEFPTKTLFLPSDLARSLGVSVKTVRRWLRTKKILPTIHVKQGSNTIPLFSIEDATYYQKWYLNKSKGKQPKYREEVSTDDNI